MKRISILGTLVIAGALTVAVAAQQAPPKPSADAITVEKLKDNLWILRAPGTGNTAVFATSNGLTIVDTKSPGWGQPLIDKVKTLSDKPITTVINTHAHYDHASGNVDMPPNVEIIAQEYTAKALPTIHSVAGIGETPNVFKDNPGKGLARKTFKDKMTIGSGADQINLYFFGPAHTGGDAFVEFVAARVVHAGDVFPYKGLPRMDKDNGGTGVGFAATVLKAANALKKDETVINGHTPAGTTTIADLREYADYLRDYVAHVQSAKKAGKTTAQAVSEWKTPEKYKGYANTLNAQAATAYAQVIFDETK
jgi:glyoxylase-like metal-dependent hydrolase (beta-lactamase superfamily II)